MNREALAHARLGLMCNCSMEVDPKEQLSPSILNRAVLISESLAESGIQVFLYCPRDVDPSGETPGYVVEDRELLPSKQEIPRVNANWTYGTRKLINSGMGYRRFKKWTRERGIGIYVPYAFSELVSNKLEAYQVANSYDPRLHPRTADFYGTPAQIESFLDRSGTAFIKPRAGNKGNQIFVLRRSDEAYSLKFYEKGSQRLLRPVTLATALGVVEVGARGRRYIIQQGVDSMRHEGSVFDVRVVMVNDGCAWHSILETRLAPLDSDLSNVFQGGSIEVTEDLLASELGQAAGRALEREIRRVSHELAEYLEAKFPGQLSELGLDLVIDQEQNIHLIEINAKPGVAGFGSENKIFDWKPEDESYYDRWVRPHVRHLTSFLRGKVENT